MNFKTSNVTVNPRILFDTDIRLLYFKTSNVTVNQKVHKMFDIVKQNFKTSNVTVNLFVGYSSHFLSCKFQNI